MALNTDYWSGPGAGFGFWWVFPLVWLLVVAGLIVFGIWAVRRLGDRRSEAALDILRRRLAAGEITQDDYERTRRALQG